MVLTDISNTVSSTCSQKCEKKDCAQKSVWAYCAPAYDFHQLFYKSVLQQPTMYIEFWYCQNYFLTLKVHVIKVDLVLIVQY
jgi:hypothetical protein